MRKKWFALLGIIMALSIILSSENTVLAMDSNEDEQKFCLVEDIEDFALMSVEELNAYIDSVAALSQQSRSNEEAIIYSNSAIKSAWLAAAQIAEDKGYTCAAALVRASV